jgi:hypothetical protein
MEGDDSLEGFLTTPQTLSMRTAREADGIIRLLSLRPGASILDCPCGYGRHSIPLAKKGFRVLYAWYTKIWIWMGRNVGADLCVICVNLKFAPDFKFERLFFFMSFTLGFN